MHLAIFSAIFDTRTRHQIVNTTIPKRNPSHDELMRRPLLKSEAFSCDLKTVVVAMGATPLHISVGCSLHLPYKEL
jgi:hypothetical protein